MLGAVKYGADASRELYDFAFETISDVLNEEIDVNYLAKTGDHSLALEFLLSPEEFHIRRRL